MNILVVTNMYPTDKNQYYGIFVKEQVESLGVEGVSVDVVFINGKENRLNYFTSIIHIASKIRQNRYDIIHAHHSYCVFPIRVAKIMTGIKTPIILTFHEGEVHFNNKLSLKNIDIFERLVLSKKIKNAALRMTDFVIAVQKELIMKLYFNGKSIVLPCGVNLDLFKPMDQKLCRKKIGLPLDKNIIFFPVSPLNKQKGFELLKKAIEYIKKDNLLLITGGNIKHKEMPYYMNAADVIVQLSLYEASPCVLKESLAVNKVLVFTDTGDARMIIGDAKGVFLCERNPEDIASKLNEALNFDGGCNGRERIIKANLSLQAVAKQIVKTYHKIQSKR